MFSLALGDQLIDDLLESGAFHDAIDIVQRQIDAMIGNAALRKVIGPDALLPVAGPDLRFARLTAGAVNLLALIVIEPGPQHLHREPPVLVL